MGWMKVEKGWWRPNRMSSTLGVVLAAATVFFIFACQQKSVELRNLDHVDGEIVATVNALSVVGNQIYFTWTTEVGPSRWAIERRNRTGEIARNAVGGDAREYTDKTVEDGQFYVYQFIAEVEDVSAPDKKIQIPFKTISIQVPSRSQIDAIIGTFHYDGTIQQEGAGYSVHLTWSSGDVPNMSYWCIVRQENKTTNSVSEVNRTSNFQGSHEYTDHSLLGQRQYMYDFVMAGDFQSPEGIMITQRYTVRSVWADVGRASKVEELFW